MCLFNPTPGINTRNIFCFLSSVRGTSWNYLRILSLKCSLVILLPNPTQTLLFKPNNLCLQSPGYQSWNCMWVGLETEVGRVDGSCLQEFVAQCGYKMNTTDE